MLISEGYVDRQSLAKPLAKPSVRYSHDFRGYCKGGCDDDRPWLSGTGSQIKEVWTGTTAGPIVAAPINSENWGILILTIWVL